MPVLDASGARVWLNLDSVVMLWTSVRSAKRIFGFESAFNSAGCVWKEALYFFDVVEPAI